MKELTLGIFGFGCVGQGLYFALNKSTGVTATVKKIVVKNPSKPRSLPNHFFSYDKNDILNDASIDVVVELIDDAGEAFKIVSESIKKGKHVVTANKKMLALHLAELIELKNKHNVSLLYEASACGSIPIIRTLEEYFDNEELNSVKGIYNGTTNYILSKIVNEQLSYPAALQLAQQKGFAETDPTSDVEGFDAMYKTTILALHGFGIILNTENIVRIGITKLQQSDIGYAEQNGLKVKLIASITKYADGKIGASVLPSFLKNDSHFTNVNDEFNAVLVDGSLSGEQFFQGRGAGSHPTGAAVLSDISALLYGYSYSNKKLAQSTNPEFTNDVTLKIFVSSVSKALLDMIPLTGSIESADANNYYYKIGEINLALLKEKIAAVGDSPIFIATI